MRRPTALKSRYCHHRSVRGMSCHRQKGGENRAAPEKVEVLFGRCQCQPEIRVHTYQVKWNSGFFHHPGTVTVFARPHRQQLTSDSASKVHLWRSSRSQLCAFCVPPPLVPIFSFHFVHYMIYIFSPVRVFASPVASLGFCQNQWRQTSFVLLSGSAPDAFTVIFSQWRRSSTESVDGQN